MVVVGACVELHLAAAQLYCVEVCTVVVRTTVTTEEATQMEALKGGH